VRGGWPDVGLAEAVATKTATVEVTVIERDLEPTAPVLSVTESIAIKLPAAE
jgi:hypothetical protein